MVGTRGFEPPTSCTPCKRSTRLNYVPNFSFYISAYDKMQAKFCMTFNLFRLWLKVCQTMFFKASLIKSGFGVFGRL